MDTETIETMFLFSFVTHAFDLCIVLMYLPTCEEQLRGVRVEMASNCAPNCA